MEEKVKFEKWVINKLLFQLLVCEHTYIIFIIIYKLLGGTWCCSWLRHCATSQKVTGSIPDGVIGIFRLTWSFWLHCGPGVDSASNRHEYQEYFLGGKGGWCVGLTTLPPSCAGCLEIWESQSPGTLRACPGLSWDCFTFLYELLNTILYENISVKVLNMYLKQKYSYT